MNNDEIERTVICYIIKDNQVLMLYRNKKEHDINKNKWIGVGGHIENGEEPIDAIIREVKEETNLDIIRCEKRANIIFHFGEHIEFMHVFVCLEFKGEINYDCNEGELKWINISDVYSLPIWEGDVLFLKRIFDNEPFFEMSMWYDKDKLVKYQ